MVRTVQRGFFFSLILYFMFSRASLKVIYLGVNLVWQCLCVYVCVLYLQAGDVSLRPASQLHTRDRSFNPEAPTNTNTHVCNTHWLTDSYTQRHTCIRERSITSNTGQIALLFTKQKWLQVKGNFLSPLIGHVREQKINKTSCGFVLVTHCQKLRQNMGGCMHL